MVDVNYFCRLATIVLADPPPLGEDTSDDVLHVRFRVQPHALHRFFRRSNVDSLISKIRAVHSREEIDFERALITDNHPMLDFQQFTRKKVL